MKHLSDYVQYSQNIRYKEYVELVPMRELWRLREFDRRLEPKFGQEESDDTINDLKAQMKIDGLTSPVRIEFAYEHGTAIISEGNHRLAAARELGWEYVPAIVFRSQVRNRKSIKILPRVINLHVVPELLRPTDIGITGCLTLAGKPVSPSNLDFYETDEVEPVPFKEIMGNLTDAEPSFGGYSLCFNRDNRREMAQIAELFDGYDALSYLHGVDGIESDSCYDFDYVRKNIISEQYILEEDAPGAIIGVPFRRYLIGKIESSQNINEYIEWLREEEGYATLADMPDGQLLVVLIETEFDDVKQAVQRVFFNHWKAWHIKSRISLFYTDYKSVHGGYMEVEESDDSVLLNVQRQELMQFKHIKKTDTSLKQIITREFEECGYRFDFNIDESTPFYLDESFSYKPIVESFTLLASKIQQKR